MDRRASNQRLEGELVGLFAVGGRLVFDVKTKDGVVRRVDMKQSTARVSVEEIKD